MTPRELSIYIQLEGLSLTELANQINESRARVSACVNGLRREERIRQKIADYFKRPIATFFGADFDAAMEARGGVRSVA